MRTRAVVAVLVAAAVLGVLSGRFVLPARSAATAARTAPKAPSSSSPPSSPSPSSAPAATHSAEATGPKAATGPVTERNLLAATAFAGVGVKGRVYVRDRFGDGIYANGDCAGNKTLSQTLVVPGAHFRGLMTSPAAEADDPTMALSQSEQVAREVAGDAGTPALAQNFTERLLLEEMPCQTETPTHWVYGSTQTLTLAPGLSASWMGMYQGTLNTTGTAPPGREPCGGLAFLRSGSHYAILEVDACLGTKAMTALVRTAVSQL